MPEQQTAAYPSSTEMPETIEINGVTYWRESKELNRDAVDAISRVSLYRRIAKEADVPLRAAVLLYAGRDAEAF